MTYRCLVVGLSDVAVQPDGDLAFGGEAIGCAIGQEQPQSRVHDRGPRAGLRAARAHHPGRRGREDDRLR